MKKSIRSMISVSLSVMFVFLVLVIPAAPTVFAAGARGDWTVHNDDPNVSITQNGGGYTLANASVGFNARYDTPVNLSEGFTFNIESFGSDLWFSVGFGETKNTMLMGSSFSSATKPGEVGNSLFVGFTVNGNLRVMLMDKDNFVFGFTETELTTPAIGRHTLKLVSDGTSAVIHVDDQAVFNAWHSYSHADFEKFNANGGAYINFYDLSATAARISDIRAVSDWTNYGNTSGLSITKNDSGYTLANAGGSVASRYNKPVDLSEGFTFKIDSFGTDGYFYLGFGETKNTILIESAYGNTKPGEVGNSLFFANNNGNLRVALKDGNGFIIMDTLTDLTVPAIGRHTLKLVDDGTFAFIHIDDQAVFTTMHSYSHADYEKFNADGGAYIDFYDVPASVGGISISDINSVKDYTVNIALPRLKNHLLNSTTLSPGSDAFKTADINNDNTLDIVDLLTIKERFALFLFLGDMVVNVSDYGAVGDGSTDDGMAVALAIQEAINFTNANPDKSATVAFESGRTYKMDAVPSFISQYDANIALFNAKNITLQGSDTTIIGNPDKRYIQITGSSNISVKGLNFTYEKPVAVTATVTARSGNRVDFSVPFRFDFSGTTFDFTTSDVVFVIPDNARRSHSYFSRITRRSDLSYRITFDSVTSMSAGTKVFIPVPGYAYKGVSISSLHSTDVTFEDCNVWNSSEFVFQLNGNDGQVTFNNVKVAPKDSGSCATVSWRDIVHAKDNRAKLTFNDCNFRGAHDDVFNISNTCLNLLSVSGDIYTVKGMDYGPEGNFLDIKEGDTLTVFHPVSGAFYGSTTVTEVVAQNGGDIRIRVGNTLNAPSGAWMYIEELAAPGSSITGGSFNGTFRIRGNTAVKNSIFEVLDMWTIFGETYEGPIPHDVTYTNCTFNRVNSDATPCITFDCKVPDGGSTTPSYGFSNIVFSGCAFQDSKMLPTTLPAGVTVIP